ncbi:MAG: hypothetical protein M1608_08165 [Candidatus Omnitrophica bacterium]|nr:hypothetical protein [Candidatus Omnitrophota bacterium]
MAIEAHGSLGVVLWAAAHKLLKEPEAKSFLAGLERSSLWMSRRVRAEAWAFLEKLFNEI